MAKKEVTYEVTCVLTLRRKVNGRTRGSSEVKLGPYNAAEERGALMMAVEDATMGALNRICEVHND